ncbi:MAG: hypothetical protein JW913_03865 [Chitinispirillaceae bacterium]|nr:hypothetical protein [Chitinispirillaceae bacterium]
MVIGDSSNWDDLFQCQFVPFIIELVLSTWEQMSKPGPSDLEDAISNRLYCALLNSKKRSYFPFHISREDLEFDMDLAKETGRKDIVFYPPLPDQEIYFCIEAKRLNAIISGVCRSLADEYVKEGMQRFVDGKYARSVRHGAMLAYVLDGDIKRAMHNIQNNIFKRLSKLRMNNNDGLRTSTIRPDDCRTKETNHQRAIETSIFRIHHLFVSG